MEYWISTKRFTPLQAGRIAIDTVRSNTKNNFEIEILY
jgi:hypothetical protein